jgi:hypothetical protein
MPIILKHQTVEAFISKVRAAYRDGNSEVLVLIARFLIARVQAGDLTDAQLRSAFGLNTTQWNNLKAEMQALINADNLVKSAVGK